MNGRDKSQVTTILGNSVISKIEGYKIFKMMSNREYRLW